ncbi:MAG: DHH family phosphoesterase [Candidatus Dojkabacteria bacterium]|nr:DHH family phosphoesterase [Candidatus Dojkabacteria bacterium]
MYSFKDQFNLDIQKYKNIIITSHINPDFDSLASTLLLYLFISKKFPNKKIQIIYKTSNNGNIKVKFPLSKLVNYTTDIDNVLLNNSDLIIFLDSNSYKQIGINDCSILNDKRLICIDHHASDPDYFDLQYIDINASSCAELIFDILWKDEDYNEEIAIITLLGIMGDTNVFEFIKPQNSKLFHLIGDLINKFNIDISHLKKTYMGFETKLIPLIQEALNNVEIIKLHRFSIIISYLSEVILENYNDYEISEAKSLYSTVFSQNFYGVEVSAFFYPSQDFIICSLRSKPKSPSVLEIAKHFGGGGHIRAAGFRIPRSNDLTIKQIVRNFRTEIENIPIIII